MCQSPNVESCGCYLNEGKYTNCIGFIPIPTASTLPLKWLVSCGTLPSVPHRHATTTETEIMVILTESEVKPGDVLLLSQVHCCLVRMQIYYPIVFPLDVICRMYADDLESTRKISTTGGIKMDWYHEAGFTTAFQIM